MASDDNNGDAMRITLRDIYAEVVALRADTAAVTAAMAAATQQLPDHEARLRMLEQDHVRRNDFDDFKSQRETIRQDMEGRLRDVEAFKQSTSGARGLAYAIGMIGTSSAVVLIIQHLS